ncbi:hypothetical protein Aros01_06791 [Streptosporangium roseum]
MLQAVALLVYLVMPDPFTSTSFASAAASPSAVAQAGSAGQVLPSHLSRDDPGRPMTASDEVAVAPRDVPGSSAAAGPDALCPVSTTPPGPGKAGPPGQWAAKGSSLAAMRPSLSALQVLRC